MEMGFGWNGGGGEFLCGICAVLLIGMAAGVRAGELQAKVPRASYDDISDIDTYCEALREEAKKLGARDYFLWDQMLCRYIDHGRRGKNDLKVLEAVFRGGVLDSGEADMLHGHQAWGAA